MPKKLFSILFLLIFLMGLSCSNIGKPPKKHHKGPKVKSSGTMNRYK